MSELRQKLQLIESTTNEAGSQAAEKGLEKVGITTAASRLRGTAAKARAKLKGATSAAVDKVATTVPGVMPKTAAKASRKAVLRKQIRSKQAADRAFALRQAAARETDQTAARALERQADGLETTARALDNELVAAGEKAGSGVGKELGAAERELGAADNVATAAEKDAALAGREVDDAAVAAEKDAAATQGYTPATRDPEAVAALNAEQKAVSDYYAKAENHVVRDGKVYGRDVANNKIGEFVELDAKTLLPKGQIGVNREIHYANGPLNRELEALEKQGPAAIEKLETKALNSAATTAEKAEIKAGGILNWIRKNPKRAAGLGILAGVITAATIYSLMSDEEEEKPVGPNGEEKPPEEDPAGGAEGGIGGKPEGGGPPGTSNDFSQADPAQIESKINQLIRELESEPTCKDDVVRLKAELARIKSGATTVAPAPAPAPDKTLPPPPVKNTPADNQVMMTLVQNRPQMVPGSTASTEEGGVTYAIDDAGKKLAKVNPQTMKWEPITAPPAPAPVIKKADSGIGTDTQLAGDPTIDSNLAENAELARWLKIARGR